MHNGSCVLLVSVVYTAHAAGFMNVSGVCLYICTSVLPIIRPLHATSAGLLLWARQAGDINRLLHGRCSVANAISVMLSADIVS